MARSVEECPFVDLERAPPSHARGGRRRRRVQGPPPRPSTQPASARPSLPSSRAGRAASRSGVEIRAGVRALLEHESSLLRRPLRRSVQLLVAASTAAEARRRWRWCRRRRVAFSEACVSASSRAGRADDRQLNLDFELGDRHRRHLRRRLRLRGDLGRHRRQRPFGGEFDGARDRRRQRHARRRRRLRVRVHGRHVPRRLLGDGVAHFFRPRRATLRPFRPPMVWPYRGLPCHRASSDHGFGGPRRRGFGAPSAAGGASGQASSAGAAAGAAGSDGAAGGGGGITAPVNLS